MRKDLPGQNGPLDLDRPVARHTVHWCDRSIEWTAIPTERPADGEPPNATWRYTLGGLSFIGFPFDPWEAASTTRLRALNWLNRHHLLVRRDPSRAEPLEAAARSGVAD